MEKSSKKFLILLSLLWIINFSFFNSVSFLNFNLLKKLAKFNTFSKTSLPQGPIIKTYEEKIYNLFKTNFLLVFIINDLFLLFLLGIIYYLIFKLKKNSQEEKFRDYLLSSPSNWEFSFTEKQKGNKEFFSVENIYKEINEHGNQILNKLENLHLIANQTISSSQWKSHNLDSLFLNTKALIKRALYLTSHLTKLIVLLLKDLQNK